MPRYLIEVYLTRSAADEAVAAGRRARAAADELARHGMSIRYVRTTFLPDDEMCFHLVDADSDETAEEVCRRAGFRHARISLAVETETQNASSRRAASTTRSGEGM